jgi:hypothetical protein
MKKFHVGSSTAFLMTLAALLIGFIWRTFYAAAPYEMFATTVGAVFGGYITKRVIAKQSKFNPECNGETNEKV